MIHKHVDDTRHPITPKDFFSADHEKTKLNWFLFEFAMELQSSIHRDKKLLNNLNKRNINNTIISKFCVYYSKSMRSEILDRVSGKTANVRINYQPIETFFPTIGDRLVNQLLTKTSEAWNSQTEACVVCPTRCISEKDRKAPMFDDPFYEAG